MKLKVLRLDGIIRVVSGEKRGGQGWSPEAPTWVPGKEEEPAKETQKPSWLGRSLRGYRKINWRSQTSNGSGFQINLVNRSICANCPPLNLAVYRRKTTPPDSNSGVAAEESIIKRSDPRQRHCRFLVLFLKSLQPSSSKSTFWKQLILNMPPVQSLIHKAPSRHECSIILQDVWDTEMEPDFIGKKGDSVHHGGIWFQIKTPDCPNWSRLLPPNLQCSTPVVFLGNCEKYWSLAFTHRKSDLIVLGF